MLIFSSFFEEKGKKEEAKNNNKKQIFIVFSKLAVVGEINILLFMEIYQV